MRICSRQDKAVHTHVFAGSRGHLAGFVDDFDGGEVVTFGHLEVVEIVGRGDLQGAGAEIQGDVGIGDDRDGAPQDRQAQGGAVEFFVALVFGIDRHRGVAQEGFGAGGGHGKVPFAVGQGVPDVVEVAVMGVVLHFEVGQGRLAAGAPVDDVVALVDQALVIEAHEDLAHRFGEASVHGEALPAPVAGAAQALELGDDLPAGFGLPLPDPLDKGVPAQGVAVLAFRGQLPFHHVLGGDAGMVGAGHPEGVEAVHALEPDQDILQGIVEGVAHMQDAGDVGRRDDDAKAGLGAIGLGMEKPLLFPVFIPFRFDPLGIVDLFQNFSHGGPHERYLGKEAGALAKLPLPPSPNPIPTSIKRHGRG